MTDGTATRTPCGSMIAPKSPTYPIRVHRQTFEVFRQENGAFADALRSLGKVEFFEDEKEKNHGSKNS